MTSDKLHILIPTDFSHNAWSATLYALNLFAEKECTFYFLNSLSLSHADSRTYITTNFVDKLTETSTRELYEWKSRAMTLNNKKHCFKILSTPDDIIPGIERIVKQHPIDLVVAGTKGATGVNKFFLGSNTVKMMQELKNIPLLAVPQDQVFLPPEHIAFPTDFNREYEDQEIKTLLEFADLFHAHIYVFHINLKSNLSDQQESNMRTLQNHMMNHQHTFHWMEKAGTKVNDIHQFVKDINIDVLAMVNYRHSFIESLIKEPVIKNIGFQPTVPFLVIPRLI